MKQSLSRPKRFVPVQVGLSHVCRYWRIVALATGELWTTISFQEPRPFAMSQAFMKRSGVMLLDLHMDVSYLMGEEDSGRWS